MTTDEKVELAQKIAKELIGKAISGCEQSNRRSGDQKKLLRNVVSEWPKWCSYAQKNGIKKAVKLAEVMQQSGSLRKDPQCVYHIIARVIGGFQRKLESLPANELGEVLGYVHRELYAQAFMSQRSGGAPRRIDNRRREVKVS